MILVKFVYGEMTMASIWVEMEPSHIFAIHVLLYSRRYLRLRILYLRMNVLNRCYVLENNHWTSYSIYVLSLSAVNVILRKTRLVRKRTAAIKEVEMCLMQWLFCSASEASDDRKQILSTISIDLVSPQETLVLLFINHHYELILSFVIELLDSKLMLLYYTISSMFLHFAWISYVSIALIHPPVM